MTHLRLFLISSSDGLNFRLKGKSSRFVYLPVQFFGLGQSRAPRIIQYSSLVYDRIEIHELYFEYMKNIVKSWFVLGNALVFVLVYIR